jgi:ribosome-associated translation inhibitor RaiA
LRVDVLERVQNLDRLIDDILACRVSVEAATRWLHPGYRYGVRIQVAMPCIEIEASATAESPHEDPYLMVADAFDVLTSSIEDFVRRRCNSCGKHAKLRR